MSSTVYTSWKCDRCNLVTHTELREPQPKGWVRIMIIDPPLASPVEAKVMTISHYVCPGCAEQLKDWWSTT